MQTPSRYMNHAETWNIRDRTNQCPPVRVVAYPQVESTPHATHATVEVPLAVAMPFRIAPDLPTGPGPCVAAQGDCEWTGAGGQREQNRGELCSSARESQFGSRAHALLPILRYLFCAA